LKLQGNDSLEARIVKNFVDIIILKYLKKQPLVSSYEILRYLHREFDIAFSPGTIYNAVYMLERKNLIKSDGNEIGRIYCITAEGEQALSSAYNSNRQLTSLVSNILSDDFETGSSPRRRKTLIESTL
jgi:DNA-binding PadR family transcriptional regulator